MSISEIIGTAWKAWADVFIWIGCFVDTHDGAVTAAATIAISVFTLALWISTRRLWRETKAASEIAGKSADAALKTAQSVELSERAYVKMSHTGPGLRFGENATGRWCTVEIKIENCGRTPARVTDVRLNLMVRNDPALLWPADPEYGPEFEEGPIYGFFVTGDYFFVRERTFQLGSRTLPDPTMGARICLVGYVDYIDSFGQRHRAGYAREHRHICGNNLVFMTQPRYSYDRPRKHDEGNDWDDPN